MPDRGVGDDRHDSFQTSGMAQSGGFRLRDEHHLAAEDEGEMGQDPVARYRIHGAFEGLFEQRRVSGRFADRLAPGALIGSQFRAVADIAEVALVDLKCFGQGDGDAI